MWVLPVGVSSYLMVDFKMILVFGIFHLTFWPFLGLGQKVNCIQVSQSYYSAFFLEDWNFVEEKVTDSDYMRKYWKVKNKLFWNMAKEFFLLFTKALL